MIICFSYPKEPILKGSSRNRFKKILNSKQQFIFWKNIFVERCDNCFEKLCFIKIWSNYECKKEHPYQNI